MALKVLYAADCEMQVTTVHKGMDNYSFSEWLDDSTWLRDALASAGDIDCTHLKVYEVMPSFPTTLEEMQAYDVIILSDVGINSLSLLPSFRPPHAVPMGPNRIDNLRLFFGLRLQRSGGVRRHADRGRPAGPVGARVRRSGRDGPGLQDGVDRCRSRPSHHDRAGMGR